MSYPIPYKRKEDLPFVAVRSWNRNEIEIKRRVQELVCHWWSIPHKEWIKKILKMAKIYRGRGILSKEMKTWQVARAMIVSASYYIEFLRCWKVSGREWGLVLSVINHSHSGSPIKGTMIALTKALLARVRLWIWVVQGLQTGYMQGIWNKEYYDY